MKILVIDGAVRKNGDTSSLLSEFLSHFPDAEIKTLGFSDGIVPCTDCRVCEMREGCSIDDKMTGMYEYICDSTLVVVASPVWYCCPSGVALNILSRFQTFFNSRKRKERSAMKQKSAAVLLAAGGSGGTDEAAKAVRTALSSLNIPSGNIFPVFSEKTDAIPAKDDDDAKSKIKETAQKIKDLSF